MVTTRSGSPIPDDTPAMLNRASSRPSDRRGGPVDRGFIGQVERDELADLNRRRSNVEPDHLGAELGELTRDMLTDARRASGDDDPPAVVAPQLVSLRHFLSASGFLLSTLP